MCGIIGYSGPKEPLPILINCLSRLEYRGYDSAGIAISDGNKITVEKKEGKLDVLKNYLKDHRVFMTSVIAALSFGGSWHIHDKDSIKTSFPSFLKILDILKK